MKKFWGLLVFVSLLFSACAPSVPGSSRYSPIDARDSDEISITAGPEWFATTLGPVGLVSLRIRGNDLNDLIRAGDLIEGKTKSVGVNWFQVQDIKAPTGWIVKLASQVGVRKILEVDGDSYRYTDSADLTWLIKVPPTTPVGSYPVLISIASRENTGKPGIEFLSVNVIKSASNQ